MNQASTPIEDPQKKDKNTSLNLIGKIGWLAAILSIIGFFWLVGEKQQLVDSNHVLETQIKSLINENKELRNELVENNKLLNIATAKEFQTITLSGNQAISPHSYAKVYLNKKDRLAYVDTKGLPTPPINKVFQLWSLEMETFNAVNIGIIDETNLYGMKLYQFDSFPESATLCITLEDEGGSEIPTMSQIYVMEMTNKK